MGKKAAPATITGGAGFNYEDFVAARLFIDMLAGTNTLGADLGRLVRLDWQARDAGWHLDDLAMTFSANKSVEPAAGCSCKRHRQVTEGGFPENFVEAIWEQWLGLNTKRTFREGQDALVLVTGQLANGVWEAWSKTLAESLSTAPERMLERLAPPTTPDEGSQSSQLQRNLLASLRCPAHLRTHPATDDDEATVRLLRHVRVVHLDFQSEPSREESAALIACQSLLKSSDPNEAKVLWDRLLRVAANKREHGGTVDFPGLLTTLRGHFTLRDHADFRSDWEALGRHSREAVGDVRCEIACLPPLARDAELAAVGERMSASRVCLLVGESGCGKSAIARRTAEQRYPRIIWLPGEVLEVGTLVALERDLGLRYPIAATLRAAPEPCVIVFDGVEGYSDRALHTAAQLIMGVQDDEAAAHVDVLLTAQIESARRVIDRLAGHGVRRALLDPLPIDRPKEREIASLVSAVPHLRSVAVRRELRPVLRNLKVLDWLAQAASVGAPVDEADVSGLTTLIERIWERWVEGDDGGFARSGLLQRVAATEAETLSAGVPIRQLEHAERVALPGLVAADLVRLRNERVRFSHDLLGDWARLRVLVGDDPAAAEALRSRASSPRWHRAIRLFGQRLLEQGGDDTGRWEQLLARLDDGSKLGIVTRDLLLEGVALAEGGDLLRRVWPVLVTNDGVLLQRLLDRFLYVATIPDPRLGEAVSDPAAAARLEHHFRIPFWPYWGAVLTVLQERIGDVVRLAPLAASRACGLWLRSMPAELQAGKPFPWRLQAAQLALAIASDVELRKAGGVHFLDDLDEIAYEAALYGAPDLPDEVSDLALQLARRRDEWPQIREQHERVRQESNEARRKMREEDPQRASKIEELCTPVFPLGPLRHPWPDGPRCHVEQAFQDVCLTTPALVPLMVNCPDVALEVLLAVCIEEPQHEDPFEYSVLEEVGVDHWHAGYPPLYTRGPFLHFLHAAPKHGVSFVLRLVNFATRRWAATEPRRLRQAGLPPTPEDIGIDVVVGDRPRRWLGNERVWTWNIGWPVDSQVVICALMALEKWLYDQMDEGTDVGPWLQRILSESESVAFAGLLCVVGKRQPSLFDNVLLPLLAPWQLYFWDHEAITQQAGMNPALIPWGMRSGATAEAACKWHSLAHRTRPLVVLAIQRLLTNHSMRDFFTSVVAEWRRSLSAEGEPERLVLLAERLNRENYKETPEGIKFEWPEAHGRHNEQDLSRLHQDMTLLTFPHQCRQLLDEGRPLPVDSLPVFWETVQALSRVETREATDADPSPVRVEDSVCGGIAVLLPSTLNGFDPTHRG